MSRQLLSNGDVSGASLQTPPVAPRFSPCEVSDLVRSLFGLRNENGKARSAARSGGNIDAMTQYSKRLAHDEETDAQTVALCGIKPGERFEYLRNLSIGNSYACVVHVDPDFRSGAPASKKDATSRLRILDGIAHQIAQRGAEEQTITEHGHAARNRTDGYSLAEREMFVLAASLPQDLPDAYWPKLEALRTFPNAHSHQELVQLLLEPVNRDLTGMQTSQFGTRSDSKAKQFVSTLDDLEWLAKVVAGHGEQQCLEVCNPMLSSSSGHPPGHGTRHAGGCPEVPLAIFRPDMVSHIMHSHAHTTRSQIVRCSPSVARSPSGSELNVLRDC